MAIESKAQHVAKRLRRMIMRDHLRRGTRLPSEHQLTSKFRVSQRTVREALIRLENDGLIERRQGSGTYVLKDRRTTTITVLASMEKLTSPTGYFYRRLVDEARKQIEGSGYRFVLSVGQGKATEEFSASIPLLEKPVSGKTFGVLSTMNMKLLDNRLDEADIPSVSISAAIPDAKHCVVLDYARMTELGAQLLKDHGYDNFVLMHAENLRDKHEREMRIEMDRILLKAVDLDPKRLIGVPASLQFEDISGVIKQLSLRPNWPRAIFFHDDALCDVATRAILGLGLRVPDELAIVTHANVGRRFEFPVKLTCVEFDPKEIAHAAWKMLAELIAGERSEADLVYIQPRIREGESLRRPPR